MKYAKLATVEIPQSEPLNERQVKNNAGGFVFALDNWKRLDRFLILGSDAPTYYQKAVKLTRENAKCVAACYDEDAARTVARIVEISDAGRAPKNDPAIFALAMGAVHKDVKVRTLALVALPKVCRISTHLFQFVTAARALGRGWGRAMKRAVASWYDSKPVDVVAFQAIKYRQREGYTHKRLLQTSHPKGDKSIDRDALYQWICGKPHEHDNLPNFIRAHEAAMKVTETRFWADCVKHDKLPWEALPTEANTKPEVWQAMLPDMGLTALIRNLGNMSRYGVFTPLSKFEQIAVDRITDKAQIKKARVHPFTILQALKVYEQGHGFRSRGNGWTVSRPIVDALDSAFDLAFDNVEPTGKRIFIGLDVSGSMSSPFNDSAMMVSEAGAAMAMTVMRREKHWHVMGFADGLRDLGLSAKMSLASVVRKTAGLTFGGTDCALPMTYAERMGMNVDAFIVITDNETWAGHVHPSIALQSYRNKSGINAKLIVMGMTSTGFTIADPTDAGMLDIVGMDSSVPVLVSDFIRN